MNIVTTDWMPSLKNSESHLFAIGDVHGHFDLLQILHEHLTALLSIRRPEDNTVVIHLGDLIDRGPKSVRCLNAAFGWSLDGVRNIVLPGNHEQMLFHFIDVCEQNAPENTQRAGLRYWLENGGHTVLSELGVWDYDSIPEIRAALCTALGPVLFKKLSTCPTAVRHESYLFVHAGIPLKADCAGVTFLDPSEVPVQVWRHKIKSPESFREATSPLWVREPFLSIDISWPDEVIVVHGHTPNRDGPDIRSNRIGIDTGAFMSGNLTMIEIHGKKMRFHSTRE